jgi:hypothetical protein
MPASKGFTQGIEGHEPLAQQEGCKLHQFLQV